MKLKLVLEADSKKKHPRILKLNIPPSKTQGFLNFVNACVKEKRTIRVCFEKEEDGEKEASKLHGEFSFES